MESNFRPLLSKRGWHAPAVGRAFASVSRLWACAAVTENERPESSHRGTQDYFFGGNKNSNAAGSLFAQAPSLCTAPGVTTISATPPPLRIKDWRFFAAST